MDGSQIYHIQYGDTPASIAEKYGMTTAELLDYHNRQCPDFGLLWTSGFTGLQKIIVPADFRSGEDLHRLKQDFLPPKSFSQNFLASKYRISEKFKNQDGDPTEITYSLSLGFSHKETGGNKITAVSQAGAGFKKNGVRPDDKISSLALDCMDAVSPVEFVVSEDGKLARLFDFKNLAKSFSKKKADIQDFHTGEVAENYIAKFEENIADEDYLFSQLSTTLYNQVLFPGNSVYGQDGKFEKKFNLIPSSFPVRILFENQYVFDDEDFTAVYMNGDIIEECTLQELLRGRRLYGEPEEYVSGTMNISYNIGKETHRLEQVSAEIILMYDEEVYYQYNLKITRDGQ